MTEQDKIRVLVADDHAILRGGLAAFLRAVDGMELVGEASNGEEAVQLARQLLPDVVLMDLKMPVMDGVEATRQIRASCPHTQVVALTSFIDDELVPRALQAGAIGYLIKNVSQQELDTALRRAAAGQSVLSPEATQALIDSAARVTPVIEALTPREEQVLALMVEGLTNLQIGKRLGITESTTKSHVSTIIAKLGVASRTEAVALALRHGLVN
ncbi:MAG: response regulator [Anaerolineae bacterium]|jgi:NarL family two-component system response regulator LiaR|nr:response regulator transcription factor [Chloroflexota bacterium]